MGISRSSPLLKSVSGATFLGDWLRLLEEVHTPSSTCLPGTERRHWVAARYRGGLLHPLQATPQKTCSPAALRYMAEGLGSLMSRKGLELMLQPLLGEHTNELLYLAVHLHEPCRKLDPSESCPSVRSG